VQFLFEDYAQDIERRELRPGAQQIPVGQQVFDSTGSGQVTPVCPLLAQSGHARVAMTNVRFQCPLMTKADMSGLLLLRCTVR
jgi:hypothetical protein